MARKEWGNYNEMMLRTNASELCAHQLTSLLSKKLKTCCFFLFFLGWLVVTKGTPSRPSIGEKLRCVLSSSTTRIELTPLCIPSRLPGLIIIICSSFEDNVFLLTWSMPFFVSCMLVVFRAERLKLQIEMEVFNSFFLIRGKCLLINYVSIFIVDNRMNRISIGLHEHH